MKKIVDAIKGKPPEIKKAFTFSFEFDIVQYPNTVIGQKTINVDSDTEDEALNQAAEILNSELEPDQHLRYTQKFSKKGN
jgi:hypothetical protein